MDFISFNREVQLMVVINQNSNFDEFSNGVLI
jgi:hypothetical protein